MNPDTLALAVMDGPIAVEVNKWAKRSLSSKDYYLINELIESVNQIWTFDTVVRYFTTHRLDHNIRVLYYAVVLINQYKLKLDSTAAFIVAAACILHDIGLQCRDQVVLNEVGDPPPCESEEFDIFVRNNHAQISSVWLKQLYVGTSDVVLELQHAIKKIPENVISKISLTILLHSGECFIENASGQTYTHAQIRKPIIGLALIVRLSDELDIGSQRGDLANPIINRLPIDNASYFWRHYITNIQFEQYGIIVINIELNPNDSEKEKLFKAIIYDRFIEKNSELIHAFRESYNVPITFEYFPSFNDFKRSIPFAIYDYLSSDLLRSDHTTINYTFARDIVEVYTLDTVLLQPLYIGESCYATTKEQAVRYWKKNPYMTFCGYKGNRLVGYLTCIPMSVSNLIELLSFKKPECDLCIDDIYSYESPGEVAWYISGLGVVFEERLHNNYPSIVYGLISAALSYAKDELAKRRIFVSHVGAIAFSSTAKILCEKKSTFGENKCSDALYEIDGLRPSGYLIKVDEIKHGYFYELRSVDDNCS